MATITSGYSQDPGAGAGYDLPWEPHVFKITSTEVLNALSVGQIVTDITYTAGVPIEAGIGGNTILSLVYNTGNSGPLYLDNNGPFRTLMGVLIIDAAGTLLTPKVLLAWIGLAETAKHFCSFNIVFRVKCALCKIKIGLFSDSQFRGGFNRHCLFLRL